MHGYFLSLKLYTTARLIANPTSYAEHRDKIVSKRLAEKAESRIRARKEQPKVNKALAERLRKAEEREEALAKRKREKKGLAAAEAEEGDQDEEEEDVEEGKKAKKSGASVLQDPRFKEIFENPEFEVDEESREFALINPATANINVSGARLRSANVERGS
jgi:ribosome biogenesis protein ENP2